METAVTSEQEIGMTTIGGIDHLGLETVLTSEQHISSGGIDHLRLETSVTRRSAIFMDYLSEQLDSITTEMSTSKRRRFNFMNVEGGVPRDITDECINTARAVSAQH